MNSEQISKISKDKTSPFLSLDALSISNDFKSWLVDRGVDTYEGSSFTLVTDLYAQYLMQSGYIANMMLSESNILRSKIWENKASLSSTTGYLPYRKKPSTSEVTLSGIGFWNKFTTQFTGLKNGQIFQFVLQENLSINTSGTVAVSLKQGTWETYSYNISDESFSKLKIYDKNIDISSLRVYVYSSNTTTEKLEYTRFTNVSSMYDSVYYVVIDSDGYYNIMFGDKLTNNKPNIGSRVYIEYIQTKGLEGNGCNTIMSRSEGLFVDTYTTSNYGDDQESLESITINNLYANNNTSITNQYKNILKNIGVYDVIAIDGMQLEPKEYGIVYVYVADERIDVIQKYLNDNRINPGIIIVNKARELNIDVYATFSSRYDKELMLMDLSDFEKTYNTTVVGKLKDEFSPTKLIYNMTEKLPYTISNISIDYNIAFKETSRIKSIEYVETLDFSIDGLFVKTDTRSYVGVGNTFSYVDESSNTFSIKDVPLTTVVSKDSIWIPKISIHLV